MTNRHILTIKNLSKSFDKVEVLKNLKISLGLGEIYAIIGPNGAGKTTLFNLITGIIPKDAGTIVFYKDETKQKFFGGPGGEFSKKPPGRRRHENNLPIDITKKKSYEIARLGIGRTFQGNRVFANMTVLENVMFARQLVEIENPISIMKSTHKKLLNQHKKNTGLTAGEKEVKNLEELLKQEAEQRLDFVGLREVSAHKAEELSYGQQKLLAIARLLMADSRLLLFDEPTAGVNPKYAARIAEIFKKIVSKGDKTILFIEHDMKFIQALGCKCLYLEAGRCPWPFFELEVIMKNPEIRRKFMGM
ncbi:MAG: ATP-binding cassette domain-containing protein [Candidatus Aminicenantes bacterium]|nr:ATP-binding cassette domain-containing protein [Candidatus Aminicenantes bacterium]